MYSFLNIENSLAKAIDTNPSRYAAESVMKFDQVHLLPTQIYLQVSNNKDGIAFDENYTVYFCDRCGNRLQNVTNYVKVNDIVVNGLPQVEIEIAPMPYDFFKKPLVLEIQNTIDNRKYYSNIFVYTNYNSHLTTQFDYLTAQSNKYQSISLACYYTKPNQSSESKEYTKVDGTKVNSIPIVSEFEQYIFDYMNGFNYRKLSRLLAESIVYVNGNRKTNRFTIESGDLIGDTDTFNGEFEICVNYNETFDRSFQLFEPLSVVEFIPSGSYTLDTLPSGIEVTFNRNIVLGSGTLRLFKDSVLFETFTETDITVTANTFTIDSNNITENGSYYILMDEGLITSIFGEHYSITNPDVWSFEVSDGEFDSNDFNNEFLIN